MGRGKIPEINLRVIFYQHACRIHISPAMLL
jgi:hypothetical protein